LLTYSFSLVLSVNHLFLNDTFAQQIGGSQDEGPEDQRGLGVGVTSERCPPSQHNVGSTNQCEWDNCGSATPSMYRNTQTGRCVSDCSEVGQVWVEQGNICVLSDGGNTISTQSPSAASSLSKREEGNGNGIIQTESSSGLLSDNGTKSSLNSSLTSSSSTPSQSIASLVGEPVLPYACDGTEDCKQLTSSGECKAEVRTVEGKPGLGECDWNIEP